MVGSFVPRLRAVPGVVGGEGNRASSGVKLGFWNEFRPRAISPVPEKHGCERSLTRWNDEIRCDRTALGTRVGNVMKGATVELFDDLVMDVEGLPRVVVEEMGSGQEIRCGVSR